MVRLWRIHPPGRTVNTKVEIWHILDDKVYRWGLGLGVSVSVRVGTKLNPRRRPNITLALVLILVLHYP